MPVAFCSKCALTSVSKAVQSAGYSQCHPIRLLPPAAYSPPAGAAAVAKGAGVQKDPAFYAKQKGAACCRVLLRRGAVLLCSADGMQCWAWTALPTWAVADPPIASQPNYRCHSSLLLQLPSTARCACTSATSLLRQRPSRQRRCVCRQPSRCVCPRQRPCAPQRQGAHHPPVLPYAARVLPESCPGSLMACMLHYTRSKQNIWKAESVGKRRRVDAPC